MKKLIIDAKGATLGRLASYAAKQALLGKELIIVNCNEILITGKKRSIISNYQTKRLRGGSSLKGPFFPHNPERLLKRTIRGMLSYQQGRGSDALKRIICYNTTPPEYSNAKKISSSRPHNTTTLNLKDLKKEI